MSPASGLQGATLKLKISGSGFTASSAVRFSGAGIVVSSVQFESPASLIAMVILSAEPGVRSLTVTDSTGASSGVAFEIRASPVSNPVQVTVSRFVGSPGGAGTRDARGSNARFTSPMRIWGDASHLYVTDFEAGTVRQVSLATGEVTTLAGSPFLDGIVDGVGAAARLHEPKDIWGDGTFLYLVQACSIRQLRVATGDVSKFAGEAAECAAVPGPLETARFADVVGLSGDASNLYLALRGPCPPPTGGSTGSFCSGRGGKLGIISRTSRTYQIRDLPPIDSNNYPPTTIWTEGGRVYLGYPSTSGFAIAILRFDPATGESVTLQGIPKGPTASAYHDNFRVGPTGTWPDGRGHVYFTQSTRLVSRMDVATGETEPIAFVPEAHFNRVAGLWGNGDDLFVADSSAPDIVRIRISSGEQSIFAGLPDTAIAAESLPLISPLNSSAGSWSDGRDLYITQFSGEIVKVSPATGELTSVFAGNAQMRGIWGDAERLYVTDHATNTVTKVDRVSHEASVLAGKPKGSGSTDGPSSQATFNDPKEIWGDDTYLYVSDTSCIRRIDKTTGDVTTLAGHPSLTGSVDGIGGAARFRMPRGLWGDGTYLYVADAADRTIRRITLATREVITFAGSGSASAIVDGIGSEARFIDPVSIWSDGAALYISDNGPRIRRLVIATRTVATLAAGGGTTLVGINRDLFVVREGRLFRTNLDTAAEALLAGPVLFYSSGTFPADRFAARSFWSDGEFMYAPSGNAIYRIRIGSGEITHLAGAFNEIGNADGIGSAARFNSPGRIWGDGRFLYISDPSNDLVRRLELATAAVTTIARVEDPVDLWGDGSNLYLPDAFNKVIRRVSLASREVSVFAGTSGQSGAQDGSGAAARFTSPGGLWGDDRYLYVTDACAIRRIEFATAVVSTIAASPEVCAGALWGNGTLLLLATRFQLRLLDLKTGAVRGLAGVPIVYGSEDGAGADARLGTVARLWSDGASIFAADGPIRRITPATASMTMQFSSANARILKAAPTSPTSLTIGYGLLQSASAASTPGAMALFALRQNGVLVSETSVPATPATRSGRIYTEIGSFVSTGVAIANPNGEPAVLSFYFTNAYGENTSAGGLILGPGQQISAFLNESPFNGTASARSFTFTSNVPVAAIALRGLLNERSEFLMTTLPVAPLLRTMDTIVIPQFAAGAGWRTQVLLVNPTDFELGGTVEVLKPDGQSYSSTTYLIAPRSSGRIAGADAAASLTVGSIHVVPRLNTPAPFASTVFSFRQNGVTVTETGVAQATSGRSFRITTEKGLINTGVAVSNNAANAVDVRLELFDLEGRPAAPAGAVTIPANGQLSRFLHELPEFSGLPAEFQGVLRIASNTSSAISVIGLRTRTNERGEFLVTTMPSIDEDMPPVSADLIFPHIVNGAGYSTEFVFIGRGDQTSSTLRLYSRDGAPLALGLY